MQTPNCIRFASSPGSIVRCYAVSKPMAGSMETIVFHPGMDRTEITNLATQSRITPQSQKAVERILAIAGLTHVILREHELFFMLTTNSWDTVHGEALRIIQECYFPDEKVEILDYSRPRPCPCPNCGCS